MNYISRIGNRNYRITLSENSSGEIFAEINGKKLPITIQRKNGDGICLAEIGNQIFEIDMTKNGTDYLLHYKGEITRVSVEDEDAALNELMRIKGIGEKGARKIVALVKDE
ncbi:hypothetical protein B6D60_06700, partial [candidate division KSB1 bacterium 4484_87]